MQSYNELGFDHVTLLSKGSVMIYVEGKEPKKFTAPTFIVVRKEYNHHIQALEDDTVYYCVFALRNIDGEVVEDIFGEEHDPMSAMSVESNYWEKRKQIENI
jgi:hypothetical protein